MKDWEFAKFVVLVNGAVPLALLAWDQSQGHLGANPVNFAIHTTGMMALIFLVLSLAVTPVRLFTGWNWLSHFRRMLGVYAFVYAAIHLSLYFGFDRSLNLQSLIDDVIKRPFILFGMIALLVMVPLTITSTNGMIKRLGSARWKQLHRLTYVAGVSAVIHYYMFGKITSAIQISFVAVLIVLLGYRVLIQIPGFDFLRKSRKPVVAR
ncbi:MAG TPA: protein-methionine-sulfoxide reductase heme-binding subunit MsrQ [Tepidisphaeraceae bacterium]|nr:protein-methionine-sulfoxide reductase heme-binding subunit MsrQ [Tepidisphaeraceae bacterium]